MRRMLIGPIIALFVVVAVAAISARSISHSFRAQASPDSTQALEKRERKDAEKTQLSSTPGQEAERKFAEAHEQAEQKRLKQETEQRQAEIKLLKEQVDLTLRREVKRWFAQARRQADQATPTAGSRASETGERAQARGSSPSGGTATPPAGSQTAKGRSPAETAGRAQALGSSPPGTHTRGSQAIF